jgi:hypothetical protein
MKVLTLLTFNLPTTTKVVQPFNVIKWQLKTFQKPVADTTYFLRFQQEPSYQEMRCLYGMLSGSAVVTKFFLHIYLVISHLTLDLLSKD